MASQVVVVLGPVRPGEAEHARPQIGRVAVRVLQRSGDDPVQLGQRVGRRGDAVDVGAAAFAHPDHGARPVHHDGRRLSVAPIDPDDIPILVDFVSS